MQEDIHFGLIGLKIGDQISFRHTELKATVASGTGTPENGGSMVRSTEADPSVLFSLKALTRKLLDGKMNDQTDIWDIRYYEGASLRELNDANSL